MDECPVFSKRNRGHSKTRHRWYPKDGRDAGERGDFGKMRFQFWRQNLQHIGITDAPARAGQHGRPGCDGGTYQAWAWAKRPTPNTNKRSVPHGSTDLVRRRRRSLGSRRQEGRNHRLRLAGPRACARPTPNTNKRSVPHGSTDLVRRRRRSLGSRRQEGRNHRLRLAGPRACAQPA